MKELMIIDSSELGTNINKDKLYELITDAYEDGYKDGYRNAEDKYFDSSPKVDIISDEKETKEIQKEESKPEPKKKRGRRPKNIIEEAIPTEEKEDVLKEINNTEIEQAEMEQSQEPSNEQDGEDWLLSMME